mgnify:CR=1 FL=1
MNRLYRQAHRVAPIVAGIAFAVSLSLADARAEANAVDWSDLIDPSAQTYDDPYRDLTYDQIDDLRRVAMLRQEMAAGPETSGDVEARLAEIIERLAADGIDADWLISQRWVVAEKRERAATSGNPEVDGRTVSLAGFAIPAPPDADGTPMAYLVPERGMCSHMPPPPASQLVHVRLTDDWQPQALHEPVRLTGRLTIAPSAQEIHIVDGLVPMQATFLMEAESVETAAEMLAAQPEAAVNEWAQGLAERMRAARPHLNSEAGGSR